MTNHELSEQFKELYDKIKSEDVRLPYQAFLRHRKKFIPEALSDKTILNKSTDLRNSNKIASQKDLDLFNKCLEAQKQFDAWYPVFLNSIELAIKEKSIIGLEKNFYDKAWCAYFFDNRKREKVKLAQVIVKIDNMGVVTINNIIDQRSEEYEGSFRLHRKSFLIFELRGIHRKDKPLYIEVISGPVPTEISIGSYITIEQDTIVSGTILFKLLEKEDRDKFKSGLFSYLEDKEKFLAIKEEIRKFLCKKVFNYNKLPKEIHNLKDLETLESDYIRNKKTLFFDVEKPIVFIASPVHSLSEQAYEEKNKLILELKKKLNDKVEDLEIIYPGADKESIIRKSRFIKNLKTLTRTHFFIYIQLNDEHSANKKASSSLIELGWGLAYCKTVLVFYEDANAVPSIVPLLNNSHLLDDFGEYLIPAENKMEFIYSTIVNEINLELNLGLEEKD